MPSYVITGASRGIGLEFVRQLSADPDNTIVALVRNKNSATKLIPLLGPKVHLLEADITDFTALKAAAEDTAKITTGSLDYLINDAAYVSPLISGTALTDFEGREAELVEELQKMFHNNVIGPILTINAFLPLLKKGATRKVITLSTGLADAKGTEESEIYNLAPYSISKAALNMANTKFSIEFKSDGFIFLAVSPGLVNTTDGSGPPTAEFLAEFSQLLTKFRRARPDFAGPISVDESVRTLLALFDRLTPEHNGAFISHKGNKTWL